MDGNTFQFALPACRLARELSVMLKSGTKNDSCIFQSFTDVPSCPEPTSMPDNSSPSWQVAGSIIGGVAMVTALLVAVCSVGFTALYCTRRSQKHQKDRIR